MNELNFESKILSSNHLFVLNKISYMTSDHVFNGNYSIFLGLKNSFESVHNIIIRPKNNGINYIQRGRNCRSKSVNNKLSAKFNRKEPELAFNATVNCFFVSNN